MPKSELVSSTRTLQLTPLLEGEAATKPPAFDQQGVSEADVIDFTPELKAEAMAILQGYAYGPLYTPPVLLGNPETPKGTLLVPGTNGGTLEVASPAGNLPNVVEIMFVDAGNDATESADDQFSVVSAGLRITKVETILDDPFASLIPRALPGSHVEYLITIENTSTTTPADGVSLNDPVPANTTVRTAQYAGDDVAITGGLVATCTADALDGDADGCGINGGALTVSTAVLGNIAASATVTLRFQVTIL